MPTICYATGCNQKIDPNTAYYKIVAGAARVRRRCLGSGRPPRPGSTRR
jgi:hypothetical protein